MQPNPTIAPMSSTPAVANNIHFRRLDEYTLVCSIDLVGKVSVGGWRYTLTSEMELSGSRMRWVESPYGFFIELTLTNQQQRRLAPMLYEAMLKHCQEQTN